MLYRTQHHPFLFPLTPFTSTPLSSSHPHPTSSSPLLSSSSSSLSEQQVVGQRMELVEGALRSSFRPDMALKTAPYYHHHHQQQALFDDLSAVNGQNAVLGDDFFVDDLLDFSNAVVEDPEEQKQEETFENDEPTASKAVSNVTSPTFSVKDDDFGSLPASELSLPADDLESLEWLSHFVDDSFSEYSLTCPPTKVPPEPAKVDTEPETVVKTQPCFTTPVQTKARSKRPRAGVPGWSLGSSCLTESSTSSTSSSSSTTTSSSPCNPWLFYSSPSQTQTAESLYGKPPVKKQKKRPATESCGGGGGGQQPRRCSHCGVQKTPQWRAGPLGAKTLCNACGVRYKSGRLLPEYRPACSPTFSSELHSNNHRKVLEMRKKKETEAGLTPPVQSF